MAAGLQGVLDGDDDEEAFEEYALAHVRKNDIHTNYRGGSI